MLKRTFFQAVMNGNLAEIIALLEEHPHLVEVKYKGLNALELAIVEGHVHCFETLVKAGIDVNKLIKGMTILGFALELHADQSQKRAIKKLIKLGANVNLKDKKGLTALHWAAVNGDADIIKICLKQNPSIEERCSEGDTPLHYAANARNVETMKALLEGGANLKALDRLNRTPLYAAAIMRHTELIPIFAEFGDQEAQKALQDVDALMTQATSDLKEGLLSRWYHQLQKKISIRVRNVGYLLAQVLITLAIPWVFNVTFPLFSLVTGLVLFARYYQMNSKNLPEDNLKYEPTIKPELIERVGRCVLKLSKKLGLSDVHLVQDNSKENLFGAYAVPDENTIVVNKHLIAGTTLRKLKAVLSHEFHHLFFHKNLLDRSHSFLNFYLGLYNAFFPLIFLAIRIACSFFISYPINLIRELLFTPIIVIASKFLLSSRQRDEEFCADKGTVALTGKTHLADYLKDLLLCQKVLNPSLPKIRDEEGWHVEQAIYYAWQNNTPVLSYFGKFLMDHPPLAERIAVIHEHQKERFSP